MKVLSIGFGFIGKAYSLYLTELGHEVYVLTKKDKSYDEARKYNFKEPKRGTSFDAIVIAVPTPTVNGNFVYSILNDAVQSAVNTYNSKNIIIKSTILPGTTSTYAKENPTKEFYFYPEFLEAKNPIGGVFNQKIKVFGNDSWTEEKAKFIENLFKLNDVARIDTITAETLKYWHNIWLAANISLWNSFVRTADKKVDSNFILQQIHKSEYFGTHPWKIGEYFDGVCLPKDLGAYISSLKEDSTFKDFLKAVEMVNNHVEREMKKVQNPSKNSKVS